jgi:HlyD family secretion protein
MFKCFGREIEYFPEKIYMDRELSNSYLKKRKKKRIIYWTGGILLFTFLLVLIPSFMEPTVDLSDYRVGKVTKGDIITSISAEGKVEPIYQEIITTPIQSRVMSLNYQPGDTIDTTASIIRLEMKDLRRKYQKINHEVALKENHTRKKREELRQRENKLEAELISDSLKTDRLKAFYENEKKLLNIGGTSRESVKQARIDYQLSKLEKKKKMDEYNSFKRMIRIDISSLNLELEMKREEMTEMKDLINEAKIQPSRPGVITRINVTPGESVSSGQEVARVSNLDEFRIQGAISDQFVDKVFSGQPVEVIIDDTTIHGKVSSLTPGIEHGDIDFSVRLRSSAYNGLKPKKQVEIRLVQEKLMDTLRIPNASFYKGEERRDFFVVRGKELIKKQVRVGLCSYNYVLVKDGLKPGDRVIISNTFYNKYGNYQRLKWKE